MGEPVLSEEQMAEEHRKALAAKERNEFLALIRQSTIKVGELPRSLIPALGFGAANLMLIKIVTGKLEVTNAKQGIEVAKIALDMARLEMGQGVPSADDLTPDERKQVVADATEILKRLEREAADSKREGIRAVPSPDESTQ